MSLSVSRAKLLKSLRQLNQRMDECSLHWNDRVQREFMERYIDPLEGASRTTVSAIEHMEKVLSRARGDCE